MKKWIIVGVLVSCQLMGIGEDYHRYLWANYQQFKGNHAAAGRWYNQLFNTAQSKFCFKGYLYHLFNTGQPAKIISLIDPLSSLFEHDSEVMLIFALALKQQGRIKESDDWIIRLSQQFKSNQNIVIQAVEALVRRKELTNAIAKINSFLDSNAQRPNFFVFYFLKAQIYQQMGEPAQAYENIKEALGLYPQFPQGWLMYALLEEQAGKYKEAIAGYSSFLQSSGQPNPQIEQHIAQLAAKMHMFNGQQTVVVPQSDCYEKAVLLFKKQQYQQALYHIDQCLNQQPKDVKSRVLKIHILLGLQAIDEAINTLVKWIEEKPFDELWVKTLHLLVRAGVPSHRIITIFQQLEKTVPDQMSITLHLADLYLRAHQTKSAIEYLQKIVATSKEKSIQVRALFQLGLQLFEQGNWRSAQEHLEKGYQLESTFAPAVNLLAYIYAQHVPEKRVEAMGMINVLLMRYPNNAHMLDTKAFILYKEKKFNEAHEILKALALKNQKDSTILLHLAKVEHKINQGDRTKRILDLADAAARKQSEKQLIEKARKKWHIS